MWTKATVVDMASRLGRYKQDTVVAWIRGLCKRLTKNNSKIWHQSDWALGCPVTERKLRTNICQCEITG